MKIASRQAYVESCRKYLGTPFKHRGRDGNGLDCAGLVVRGLLDLGYKPFDKSAYGREPHKDGLRETVEANLGKPLVGGIADAKPGDLCLMKFSREPHHLAILGDYKVAPGFTIIHSYGDVGKVVEHRLDDMWTSRIVDVYGFECDEDVA